MRELPALVWDDALTPLRNEAERIVRRVLSRAAEYSEVQWDPNIEISDDPLESSWQLAAIAPLGQLDQLRLLRSTTVGGLLRELIDLTLAAEPVLTTTVGRRRIRRRRWRTCSKKARELRGRRR